MLTFFRRIRKGLLGEGVASKYLVYATGEIALVVIGITRAALRGIDCSAPARTERHVRAGINNWNEFRKLKQIEKNTLIEIREDVKATLADIELDSNLHKISLDASLEIMQFLSSNEEWHDTMAMLFELAYYDFRISSIESSYRSLEAKGMDLISNRDLRNQVSHFYDYDIPWLRRVETGNGRFNDLLLPYYTEQFTINRDSSFRSVRDIDRGKKARDRVARGFIPIDIRAFRQDPKFKVLLREAIYERIQIYDAYCLARRNAYRILHVVNDEVGGSPIDSL